MPRRLAPIFIILSLVFLPLFFAPAIIASDPTTLDELDVLLNTGNEKNLRDFCTKRQGNQMNLETWYSGKCVDDTLAGDGVGFSDIVILDLQERLTGKKDPSNTFSKMLEKIITDLKDVSLNSSSQELQLAINSARQQLFAESNSGLIGQSGNLIGMLFINQPASTNSYLNYVAHNLRNNNIIPPALAANGIGFETFSPFLTIWLAFRNLAYLGLIVFFIVYGFMMMFRVNLGQKTVISVQLAIPKLIVTLLIITFSYAIVGLVYDLMWVIIGFIFTYFQSQGIIISAFMPSLAGGFGALGLPGSAVINMFIAGPAGLFGVINLIFGGVASTIIMVFTSAFNWIIYLGVLIAVLVSYAKLFFKLVSAFISVVLSLITGPIVLLGNALPGSTVIGTWFRGIVANLSVFPITMLLLFFSYMLMVQPVLGICSDTAGIAGGILDKATSWFGSSTNFGSTCEWVFGVKNLVPSGSTAISGVPLMSPLGFSARGLLALLGVGLILMTSKYVDIVRDSLKVPPFKYGSDISAALQVPVNMAKSVAKAGEKVINLLKP